VAITGITVSFASDDGKSDIIYMEQHDEVIGHDDGYQFMEQVNRPYKAVFDTMTADEYEALAQIVNLEAGNQPFDGRVAVVECVMNRVICPTGWKNTVLGVLSQRGQFVTWPYRHKAKVVPEDYAAIEYVRENGNTVISGYLASYGLDFSCYDYTYFATKKQSYARNHIKIHGHYFGMEK
ncbi:MAG: cell wall hydrolase, partial [Bacteroidales bacterium]|nr:cell wall hydrolase [Bacteroidales bacterium]